MIVAMTIDTIEDNKLIVFTESYPYGKGEQFLETEVPYLVSNFKEVTIVPINIEGPGRYIPDSIKIERSLAQMYLNDQNETRKARIMRLGISALSSHLFYEEFVIRSKSFMDLRVLKRVASDLNDAMNVRKWLLSYVEGSNITFDKTLFYTYWFTPVTMGLLLAKSEYPRIKVISRAHGYDLYEEVNVPFYIPFRRTNLERIDKVFAISYHGEKYLFDRYKIPENRIALSKLGVDDPGFNAACPDDQAIHIVSCSFLVSAKRVDLLMEGIQELADRRPDLPIEWSHLGDGALLIQLEAKARSLFTPSVKYRFYGRLPQNGIIKFYREHPVDVFINVSKSEGIPVSIMEAQSCGIPVIGAAVGGVPEIVNNENGILLSSNPTPIEIADAIEKFSNRCKYILNKRKSSKLNWHSKYNAKINYQKFCNDILKLL